MLFSAVVKCMATCSGGREKEELRVGSWEPYEYSVDCDNCRDNAHRKTPKPVQVACGVHRKSGFLLRIRDRDKGGNQGIKIIPLVPTATTILERRSKGKRKGDLVFQINSASNQFGAYGEDMRPLLVQSLKNRLRAAGAGGGLSWLRHEATTVARNVLAAQLAADPEAWANGLVSGAMNHADTETTLRFYLLSDDARELERKGRVVELLESLLP